MEITKCTDVRNFNLLENVNDNYIVVVYINKDLYLILNLVLSVFKVCNCETYKTSFK